MPLLTLRRLVFPHRAGLSLARPAIFAALAVALAGPAAAQRITSEEVADCYDQATNLFEQDEPREALNIIRACLAKESRTPDERAVLSRFAAQLEAELGNDAETAELRRALEEGISTHEPTTSEPENYFFLGRLYLVNDPPDYEKAIQNMRAYIASVENPDPDGFYYLALALSRTNRCDESIPFIQRAIMLTESADAENRRYAHSKDEAARRKRYHELMLYCCSKFRKQCAAAKD